jgi:hypothetical protein
MWAESSILDNLPNGGAVVATIAVVVLFLKKQESHEVTMKNVVDAFTKEITAARKEYLDHLTDVMNQGLAAHRETRDAIRKGVADTEDEKRV